MPAPWRRIMRIAVRTTAVMRVPPIVWRARGWLARRARRELPPARPTNPLGVARFGVLVTRASSPQPTVIGGTFRAPRVGSLLVDQLPPRHSAWIARDLARGDLAPLGAEDIVELASRLGEHSYPAGTTLFRARSMPACVHIVRSGSVRLTREVRGRQVTLQILRPGDVIGDVPLLVRMTEPFDAIAVEDSVVLSIDSVELSHLLERRPRLAQRWLVSVAMRMAATQARLAELLAGGLEVQLASLLLREADDGSVRLSQAILAELLGARRTSVNRLLRHLESTGLVRLGYGEVEIVDPVRLLTVATGPIEADHTPASALR